jgi:hypothetical protein
VLIVLGTEEAIASLQAGGGRPSRVLS